MMREKKQSQKGNETSEHVIHDALQILEQFTLSAVTGVDAEQGEWMKVPFQGAGRARLTSAICDYLQSAGVFSTNQDRQRMMAEWMLQCYCIFPADSLVRITNQGFAIYNPEDGRRMTVRLSTEPDIRGPRGHIGIVAD